MVFHFFTKATKINPYVSTIGEEIAVAQHNYKNKVLLLEVIWNNLSKKNIKRNEINNLSDLFTSDKLNIYDLMIKSILSLNHEWAGFTSKNEVRVFSDLINHIDENVREQKKIWESISDQLLAAKIPTTNLFYKFKDLLKEEGHYLAIEEVEFNSIEKSLLSKSLPGAGSGGYIHLVDAIEHNLLSLRENQLYFGDLHVQGVKIKDNMILIKGDHYSSLQNAKWISGDAFVHASSLDPFSYFVERGKFRGWKVRKIQQTLGIKNAEALVGLEIVVYPKQVFVKIKKNNPIKFAIAHLKKEQIERVIQTASKVA